MASGRVPNIDMTFFISLSLNRTDRILICLRIASDEVPSRRLDHATDG